MKMIFTTLLSCTLAVAAYAQSGSGGTGGSSGSSGSGTSGSDQPYTPPSSSPSTTTPSTPSTPSTTTPSTPSDKSQQKQPQQRTGAGASGSEMGAATAWPQHVTVLSVQKGKKVEATGSLASGQKMADMNLPTSCISTSDKEKFAGNQVHFGVELPAKSDLTVTVTPTDPSKKLSVYAYSLPSGRFDLPNAVSSPLSCKSATKAGWRGDSHQRMVKISGGKEMENVLIGVTGPADMTSGDFTITLDAR